MTFFSFGLLIIAALFHSTWNYQLKNTTNRLVTIWWAILLGSGLFLPTLFFTGIPDRSVWGWFGISVLIEIGYYIVLSKTYEVGDFSVVYPFARGSAPFFLLIWSVLFLGESLTPGGIAGVVVLVIGLLVLTFHGSFSIKGKVPTGISFALLLGLLISMYTAIDGGVVKHTSPISYGILIFFAVPLLTGPLIFWRYGNRVMFAPLKQMPWRILMIGIFSVAAYLLTLLAYQQSKVGYSGTVREISVVFGAIAGWLLMKEKFGPYRVIGSIAIFCGLLMIGFLG